MRISKVLAANQDAITIQAAKNVWVDHCELWSDQTHDKTTYDGLCDINHASDWITVSHTYFHDHVRALLHVDSTYTRPTHSEKQFKTSLVGHSDRNGVEDTGHLRVTFANNYWRDINSRAPSIRFGTGHIFKSVRLRPERRPRARPQIPLLTRMNSSYYTNVASGINARMGAQVLVQSCVFEKSRNVITSKDSDSVGYAVVEDVDLGGAANNALMGTLTTVPYSYTLLGSGKVKASVLASAGQKLDIQPVIPSNGTGSYWMGINARGRVRRRGTIVS